MQNLLRLIVVTALISLVGCTHGQATDATTKRNLLEARRGFATTLLVKKKTSDPILQPPAGFQLIHYRAPLGDFPAYVTVPPPGNVKHPAIIWLAGGFSNSIGDDPWAPATPDNDQSARAFPQAGIVTMYPSLRGGNGNPGYNECLYGEVDDVLAAVQYLLARPDIDSSHIYLGGHSTGGTLALLVAESTSGFRAVFSFGPVAATGEYGIENLPFDYHNEKELFVRAPVLYLNTIVSPTFVFEGTDDSSNIDDARKMYLLSSNPKLHFYQVSGMSHFSDLALVTPVIAAEIASDTGITPNFSFIKINPKIVPITH